jgi:hypothetical protein
MDRFGRDDQNNSISAGKEIKQKRQIVGFIVCLMVLFVVSLSCSFANTRSNENISPQQKTATAVKYTEIALKKTIDFYIPTEERVTYFPPTQTAYWQTQAPILTQNSIKATQAKIAFDQTNTAAVQTMWAESDSRNKTLAVEQTDAYKKIHATETEKAKRNPPVIRDVSYPSVIPGDGDSHRGRLYFSDADGNIAFYQVEIVQSDPPGWPGITVNPKDRLVEGDWYNGAIWIGFHCIGKHDISANLMLIDSQFNYSNKWYLEFSCR